MTRDFRYRDRRHAGQVLAAALVDRVDPCGAVVLGLARGGIPVASVIAGDLPCPLDVFVVRKLGVPESPELAMGAIASGGFQILNQPLINQLHIPARRIADVVERERRELELREALYRADRPSAELHGRTVVLVDDGIATGSSLRAAIGVLRQRDVRRLIVAAPVGAADTCEDLAAEVDALICPIQPDPFLAVGFWYEDFSPTTDEEVRACLAAANATAPER